MTWLLRRLLAPLLLASAACTILLFVWTLPEAGPSAKLTLSDVALGYRIILLMAVVGMILLVPIALALQDLSLSDWIYRPLVLVVGAMLGLVVVIPISDNPPLTDMVIAAVCGAVSAAIWLAFNRGHSNR